MKKEKGNQLINCDVKSCEYLDCNKKCSLDQIKVTCNCDSDVAEKDETICNSFKEKKIVNKDH